MGKSMLYTATGDKGMTSLVGGTRVRKTSPRLEAYGTLDELNSFIGVVDAGWRESFGDNDNQVAVLYDIQNMLFNIGAYLATDNTTCPDKKCGKPDDNDISSLEKSIDDTDAAVPPMHCFVLPGGTALAAHIHVARAVSRRAERRVLALADTGITIDPHVIRYLNRLSDYLFALARLANHLAGINDRPWR